MSFFEPPPPPTEPEEEDLEPHDPEWMGPPDNVLGTPVPLRLVLARTDAVAVMVNGVTAFPTGVSFGLSVRRRKRSLDPFERMPFGYPPAGRESEQSEEILRLGVEFADGAKATTVDSGAWGRLPDETPDRPVLMQGGGGGGMGRWDFDFWIWPLPPAGSFAFVCEWREEGIEITRQELDAAVFREAAEHAETLWEDGGSSSGGVRWTTYGG